MVRPPKWGLKFLCAILHYLFKFPFTPSIINNFHSSKNTKNKNNLNVNIKHPECKAKKQNKTKKQKNPKKTKTEQKANKLLIVTFIKNFHASACNLIDNLSKV